MSQTQQNGSRPLPPVGEDADPRSQRARTEQMTVRPLGGGVYEVRSESGHTYTVDLPGSRCTCPDHVYRRAVCKHLRRVAMEVTAGRVPAPGEKAVECRVCGREFFVDERDAGPFVCEDCDVRPGEFVVDRETDAVVVVVRRTDRPAHSVAVPGDGTVADYPTNEGYPEDDPVVEVVYPLPAGLDPESVEARHLRRYSFPLSRLRHPRARQ